MKKQAAVMVLPTTVGKVDEARETPEAQRLEQVLAKIRGDASERSRHYRDDTVVPEGGE